MFPEIDLNVNIRCEEKGYEQTGVLTTISENGKLRYLIKVDHCEVYQAYTMKIAPEILRGRCEYLRNKRYERISLAELSDLKINDNSIELIWHENGSDWGNIIDSKLDSTIGGSIICTLHLDRIKYRTE